MNDNTGLGRDWFVSAIETDGSVSDCLNTVSRELQAKIDFMAALQTALGEKKPRSLDPVSELGNRIKSLESTLQFRLSILSPERKGAWFRSVNMVNVPFKENLFPDPVFGSYDETQHAQVYRGLQTCWQMRNMISYPFRASESCLWHRVLATNYELECIDAFSPKYPRLSELPDNLPVLFESRSLKAFLINVRSEIVSLRHRLAVCYQTLSEACERFWRHQATIASKQTNWRSGDQARTQRSSTTGPRPFVAKTASDLEALRFMGFVDYPTATDLKSRYHTLARDMHPDRPGGNEHRFKMLNKSYQHLSKVLR